MPDAHPVAAVLDHRRLEEHRDRAHLAQRRLVGESGGDPCRLLRWEQVVRTGGLHLGDAFERVQQLVQLVGVPDRDQVVAVLGPGAGAHR